MEITQGRQVVALPGPEVPMIEPDSVRQIRLLQERGWGAKRIARELGIARNTVRRYLRDEQAGEAKEPRPGALRLGEAGRKLALELFEGAARGNARVVVALLAEHGYQVHERVVQKVVATRRRELRSAELASVRYETAPGQQMQIDFGQTLVSIAAEAVRVHLLVAVLSYSRRLFVKAFLAERQDDWREGIAAAFRRFGGVPRDLLGDNARALVLAHDRITRTVTFHPTYVEFCRDWDVVPRACAPYRARTKGKGEAGVKYVKRNALAGRRFDSFVELEAHLERWMDLADQRVHGTTHETPLARFERDEKRALRPLPARPLPAREQHLFRRVANDAFVDVDTVRCSVPHQLVRARVAVAVGDTTVRIFHGARLVATHARSNEPHDCVVDPLRTTRDCGASGARRRLRRSLAAARSPLSDGASTTEAS